MGYNAAVKLLQIKSGFLYSVFDPFSSRRHQLDGLTHPKTRMPNTLNKAD